MERFSAGESSNKNKIITNPLVEQLKSSTEDVEIPMKGF